MTRRRGATKGEPILNGILPEVNVKVVKSVAVGKILQIVCKLVRVSSATWLLMERNQDGAGSGNMQRSFASLRLTALHQDDASKS
jgi:hypothetical protein